MAASLNDQFVLSGDTGFQGRVQSAVLAACISIANEGWTIAFHRERSTFAMQLLAGSNGVQAAYMLLFANSVSTDTNVIADATQAGTVALTPANRAAQAALVTDAHINTAVAAQFNTYFRCPAS